MKDAIKERLVKEFGLPSRDVVKVTSWNLSDKIGLVVQKDQPIRENASYIWLPHPGDGQPVPEIALEYPAEAGRHSGTYPVAGLKRGEPALKLTIREAQDFDDLVGYIRAMLSNATLPNFRSTVNEEQRSSQQAPEIRRAAGSLSFINHEAMPKVEPVKPRREAIPRLVQREVWQRDGGRCVECDTRERLCFDHIVPFSKGGGNSVRNLQLLCEGCNLSKSNRI